MTTTVQTEKMIYESEEVAGEILRTLQLASPEVKFHVVRVTSGWQVCPVKVLPPFMPGKPAPVAGLTVASAEPAAVSEVLEYVLTYKRETKAWLWFEGGGIPWIKKSHLISHKLEGTQVTIRLSKETAIKQGLVKKTA